MSDAASDFAMAHNPTTIDRALFRRDLSRYLSSVPVRQLANRHALYSHAIASTQLTEPPPEKPLEFGS